MICEEPGASALGLSPAQIHRNNFCTLYLYNLHYLTQCKHLVP